MKILSVLSNLIILLFILLTNNCYAQYISNDENSISEEEYKVINTIFNAKSTNTKIYFRTYYDKSWKDYFEDDSLTNIYIKECIPTVIENDTLMSLLTKEKKSVIINMINRSRPIELEENKMNVKLSKSFDSKRALKNGVLRITKPIIVDNLAIMRVIGTEEAPIYILMKESGEWKIVYTFCDWLYLY